MSKNLVELMACCKDWEENLPKINAPIELQFIRTGVQYTGKPFVYCPWCGIARTEGDV